VENSGIMFNRNLDEWKINREFFIRMAMSKKFLKMLTKKTYENATDMFKLWDVMIKDNRDVDLAKWLEKFAGDMAVSTSTGLHAYSMFTYFNSHAPGISYYDNKIFKPVKDLENLLLELIQRRRAEIDLLSNDTLLPSDFLTLLLTVNTPRDLDHALYKSLSRSLKDHEIFGVIRDIFLGAIETPVEVGGDLWKEEQLFVLNYQKINSNKNDWIDAEIFDLERFLKNENSKRSINAKEANNKRAFATFGVLLVAVLMKYDMEFVNKDQGLDLIWASSYHWRELKVRLRPRMQDT
ncbi:12162_t:CDS:2, partial [Racocetra fulgida]